VFQNFDKFGGGDTVTGINGVTDAVKRLANPGWEKQVNKFFDGFANGVLNLPKSDLGQMEDRLKGLGDAMGNMVKNGGAEAAAKSFRLLTDEFKANGKSAQDALDAMPGYKDALLEQANALGVNLEPAQLLELAQGRVPGVMSAAQNATENKAAADEAARRPRRRRPTSWTNLVCNLDGTIASLEKYTRRCSTRASSRWTPGPPRQPTRRRWTHQGRCGGSHRSSGQAVRGTGQSTEAAKAHAEAQMGLGVALNKNKTDFDLTNAAGRASTTQFQSVAHGHG
jgi:hypothetical protein